MSIHSVEALKAQLADAEDNLERARAAFHRAREAAMHARKERDRIEDSYWQAVELDEEKSKAAQP